MTLNNIDFLQLLPQFMREEKTAQAFAYAVQRQLNKITENIIRAKIYSRIEDLDEKILDELAWQFNVSEYNVNYDISVKRKLIKDCMITHHNRGTVAAVETTVKNVFGDATIKEWFEYGGQPYHFKVFTSNAEASDEMLADLDRIIRETQNIRSYLEEVVVELFEKMNLYIGCKVIIMDDVSLKTIDVF